MSNTAQKNETAVEFETDSSKNIACKQMILL